MAPKKLQSPLNQSISFFFPSFLLLSISNIILLMTDRRSGMVQSFGYPQNGSIVSRAVAAAAANNHHSNRNRGRGSKRYSVSVFYSMAAEQDVEVEDELAKGRKQQQKRRPTFSNCFLFSSKTLTRTKKQNLNSIEKELYARKRRTILGCENWIIDPESNGT